MRERVPALIALLLLVTLVIGTWWAAEFAQRAIAIDPPRRVTHEPDSWAKNFIMVRSDANGVANNRLEGETMTHYPDDDSYEVTQAKAIGLRPDAPITIGTSNLAVMDQDGARITMKGNAHVHRQPGPGRSAIDVNSEQLTLLPDEDVVFTDLPALVVNGRSTMNGVGMRYDNSTQKLQVFSATDVKISGQDSLERRSRDSDSTEEQP